MASLRDTLANLVEQYKQSDTPLANIMRGDTEGAKQSVANAFEGMTKDPYAGMNASTTVGSKLAPALLGHTAYHGSPYVFEKFLLDKVGKGEGAQAYGHGIYFAENPAVAKDYAESVKDTDKLQKIWNQVDYAKNELNKAINAGDTEKALKFRDLRDKLWNLHAQNNMSSKGNLYTVDIPDEHIPKMLDWDKPFSSQESNVKNIFGNIAKQSDIWKNYISALPEKAKTLATNMLEGKQASIGDESLHNWKELERLAPNIDHNAIHDALHATGIRNDVNGKYIYQSLTDKLGSQKAASDYLQSQGIPGIKYLDAMSRDTGGTRNFVTFDPSEVKILERNGKIADLLKQQ